MSEQDVILDLMRTLVNSIIAIEAVSDHASEVANELDANFQSNEIDLLRNMARKHRVRSLELQGQLAIASEKYIDLIQINARET
jgi:hypothetical protein